MTVPSGRLFFFFIGVGFLLIAVGTCVWEALPSQNPLTIRATTRLVEINVVVHEKKGAPVRGLTRDDFSIFDGRKEERIATFSVESRQTPKGPLEPLPPNVFCNRVAREGVTPTSVVVILLDAAGTTFWDLAYARQQVIKFLSQLQPQDRVALYVLGRELHIVQDFTRDPAPLIEAIRANRVRVAATAGGITTGVAPSTPPNLAGPAALAAARLDSGLQAMSNSRDIAAQWMQADVLNALEAIARHLCGLPGRKSILWVTGSVPFPQNPYVYFGPGHSGTNSALGSKVSETIRMLNQADVALYPVDARGLFADPGFNAENREVDASGSRLQQMNLQIQGMIYHAVETGGRAFYNTNDLKMALRAALDDSEFTYTLGYYPTHGQWDGRYHPITVRVNRRGVQVRCRKGYFATAEEPPVEDAVTILQEAALNPLDATSVGLTVHARPVGDAGDSVEVTVNVEAKDLTFQPTKGLWSVRFDAWLGQHTNTGASLQGISKSTSADLRPDTYEKIMAEGGVSLTFKEKIEPGAQELRVVVRDASSGSIGSVRIPLKKLLTASAH
jgi:VWFA-related protein